MNGDTVVVTGAAGFFGGHVVEELIACGETVRAVVRPGGRRLSGALTSHPKIQVVEADLNSLGNLDEVIRGACAVCHVAGIYRQDEAAGARDELFRTNVEGTRKILSAALANRVPRFIYVSSAAAGEVAWDQVITETNGRPVTDYGESKREAEKIFLHLKAEELDWTIFRPTILFGEQDQSPISKVIRAIRRRRFCQFGSGQNCVNAIYVKDAAAALAGSLRQSAAHGRIFLLNDDSLTWKELCVWICEDLGMGGHVPRMPALLGHGVALACEVLSRATGRRFPFSLRSYRWMTQRSVYSSALFREETAIVPPHGTREGIRRTVAWLQASGSETSVSPA